MKIFKNWNARKENADFSNHLDLRKVLLCTIVIFLGIYAYLGYLKSSEDINWNQVQGISNFKQGIDKDKNVDFSLQYQAKPNTDVFVKGDMSFYYQSFDINFNIIKPLQIKDQITINYKIIEYKGITKNFALNIKLDGKQYDFYLLDNQKYASNYSLASLNFILEQHQKILNPKWI